jgi:hypothetical protein
LGRFLILWIREVDRPSGYRASLPWLGLGGGSEPSPDHSRITHSR